MKLAVKTIWIPTIILVVVFGAVAWALTSMIKGNVHEGERQELSALIRSEQQTLEAALSLVATTAMPADAFLGLDAEDSGMAEDMLSKLSSLGLSGVFFHNLEGALLYAADKAKPPEGMRSHLQKIDTARPAPPKTLLLDGSMVTSSTAYDVETPLGFVSFTIQMPEALLGTAADIFSDHRQAIGQDQTMAQNQTAAAKLQHAWQRSTQSIKAFLDKMMFTLAAIILGAMILVIITLVMVAQGIIRPVSRIGVIVDDMSDGKLTERIAIPNRPDEIMGMASRVNLMADSMGQTAMMMKLQSATMASVSTEFSNINKGLAEESARVDAMAEGAVETNKKIDSKVVSMSGRVDSAAESVAVFPKAWNS